MFAEAASTRDCCWLCEDLWERSQRVAEPVLDSEGS